MKKSIRILIMICGVLFLTGCSLGEATDEVLSKVLTEMNSAEEESKNAQKNLNELEQSEQALFNTVMDLTQEDQDEVKVKVAELGELLAQRLVFIQEEEEAVQKAKDLSKSMDSIVSKTDADAKKEMELLQATINERYDLHKVFVEAYKRLTASQKELYEKLLKEETELVTLETQVDEINELNEKVKMAIEEFNSATIRVNELKNTIFSHLKK